MSLAGSVGTILISCKVFYLIFPMYAPHTDPVGCRCLHAPSNLAEPLSRHFTPHRSVSHSLFPLRFLSQSLRADSCRGCAPISMLRVFQFFSYSVMLLYSSTPRLRYDPCCPRLKTLLAQPIIVDLFEFKLVLSLNSNTATNNWSSHLDIALAFLYSLFFFAV